MRKPRKGERFLSVPRNRQCRAASGAKDYGLDPSLAMDYDFDDAAKNSKTYISEVMDAIAKAGGDTGDGRFQTK